MSNQSTTSEGESCSETRIKQYVLDTNVLLHDPQALFKFEENTVVIPIVVIEEIDRFKKEQSELGRSARQCSRYLDQLRKHGKLSAEVALPNGGRLRVDLCQNQARLNGLNGSSNDNTILRAAVSLQKATPDSPVIFVSKDTNARIKADAFGLTAVDYDDVKLAVDDLYTGNREILVSGEQIDKLFAQGRLELEEITMLPNEFVLLRNQERLNNTALGRYSLAKRAIQPIKKFKEGLFGLQPRNKEQLLAFDLLLDDEVKLVTMVGKAGTGKTLLALAGGLHKTSEEGKYLRLVVSRPIFPLGRDIGFLPGDINDKLSPWMKPIFDNVEFLLESKQETGYARRNSGRACDDMVDKGLLVVEPLTYIRGRSLPHQYLIIDEAQNLTPHEIKTIITRAGEGTKVVLTGDPYQIDNPYIDSTNNGLTYVVERFKREALSGHITLVKGERSELAELAANLL